MTHIDVNPMSFLRLVLTEFICFSGTTVTIDRLDSNDLWLHCHAENTMFPTVGDLLSASSMWQRQVVAQSKYLYIESAQAHDVILA